MAKPRLTAVVRRGLTKIVSAAQSDRPVVLDNDVMRARTWADLICHHHDQLEKTRPPREQAVPGSHWVLTPNGWVQKPKPRKRRKTQRVAIIND